MATTWAKGQSGNPKGRPAGIKQIEPVIKKLLNARWEAGPEGATNRDRLASVLLEKAYGGDMDAIKTVLERVDGKVVQSLEHGGEGGGPLVIRYVNDWREMGDDAPDRQ